MTETLPEVDPDEFLERFVSENWIDKRGNLKWQALQIHAKDEGALSVARLDSNPDQCKEIGLLKMNSFAGFAETIAHRMTELEHEVAAEPLKDFLNHAVINFNDLNPDWPIPYEVGPPSPAKLAESEYYKALLPHFRLIEISDPSAAVWGAERLGQVA